MLCDSERGESVSASMTKQSGSGRVMDACEVMAANLARRWKLFAHQ